MVSVLSSIPREHLVLPVPRMPITALAFAPCARSLGSGVKQPQNNLFCTQKWTLLWKASPQPWVCLPARQELGDQTPTSPCPGPLSTPPGAAQRQGAEMLL